MSAWIVSGLKRLPGPEFLVIVEKAAQKSRHVAAILGCQVAQKGRLIQPIAGVDVLKEMGHD